MRKVVIAIFLYLGTIGCWAVNPKVNVEVSVVEDDNLPVEGAKVVGIYSGLRANNDKVIEQYTDADGKTIISGRSRFPVRVKVSKDDYYESKLDVVALEKINGKDVYTDQKVLGCVDKMRSSLIN